MYVCNLQILCYHKVVVITTWCYDDMMPLQREGINMGEKDIRAYTETVKYEIDKTSVYLGAKSSQIFDSFNFGLTVEQYHILDTVYHHKDICQRDIAKLMLKDRSNTGRILNILEEKGLIERRLDTKGKKMVKKVTITDKGIETVDKIFPVLRKYYLAALTEVTEEELATLRRILRKLCDSLSKNTQMQI